nr:hypothetical protein [Tanacetum cinerariifolium]
MHVILIRGVDVFFRLSRLLFKSFKTLCLLKYALMERHDYDITSSLRRWALQKIRVYQVTRKVGYAFSVWSALFWHMDFHFQTLSVMFGSAPSGVNNSTDEPFILASQAEQVMYVEDPIEPEWEVAIKMTSRDTLDMGEDGNYNTIVTRAAQSPTIENQQQNNPVHVVESDSDEEIEAHIRDESEEEFDDTIDDTSDTTDNDGVGNMRDDESDDD